MAACPLLQMEASHGQNVDLVPGMQVADTWVESWLSSARLEQPRCCGTAMEGWLLLSASRPTYALSSGS